MGLNKKAADTSTGVGIADAPKQEESGTQAAIERLKNTSSGGTSPAEKRRDEAVGKPAYKQRDFDKEAKGKTRCVQFEAALMSPAIAGMQFNTMEEYLKLVRQAADAGVAYSFEE